MYAKIMIPEYLFWLIALALGIWIIDKIAWLIYFYFVLPKGLGVLTEEIKKTLTEEIKKEFIE